MLSEFYRYSTGRGNVVEKKKFEAVLILLVPQVVQLITEHYGCSEVEASKEFYASKVYALLEQEEIKLWHFSALTLFQMFDEEKRTGKITFPEET